MLPTGSTVNELTQTLLDFLLAYGPGVLTAILVIFAGWYLSGWLGRNLLNLLPKTSTIDETIRPLLTQLIRYGILVVALVIALGELGVQTTSILAVLGAAGLAVALALQGTLSNLAAGIMLIWLRPLKVGEYIDAQGVGGTVMEIGLFATRFQTADGLYVFTPNSTVWAATITNYSREATRRLDVIVGIAYDADIAKAKQVLLDVANSDMRVLSDPAPQIYVNALGASSVDILVRVWTPTVDYWDLKFFLTEQVKLALDEHAIEIPFPHVRLIAPELEQRREAADAAETGNPD